MTNRKVVIITNNIDRGEICLSMMCIFVILTYVGLQLSGYQYNMGEVTYRLALQGISFFFSIIFGLLGYFYIYGDVERDFWKIALTSMFMIIVMNLRIIDNLIRYINSLI